MKVEFNGLKELQSGLNKRTDLRKVKETVRLNGSELDQRMTRNAEFVKGYQTGATKRSIRLSMLQGGLTAKVGPTTSYAPYLEMGTRFMSSQPFVGPSFYEQRNKFIQDLERIMK